MGKDPISNDELCSDSYPTELKFNGTIMEVTGANIKEAGGIDDALIGGNASAEGGDEGGADDCAVTGINVVMNAKLNPTQFGKKSFKDWELYVGENMDPEGTLVFMNYREDGVAPYF